MKASQTYDIDIVPKREQNCQHLRDIAVDGLDQRVITQ